MLQGIRRRKTAQGGGDGGKEEGRGDYTNTHKHAQRLAKTDSRPDAFNKPNICHHRQAQSVTPCLCACAFLCVKDTLTQSSRSRLD